MKEIEVGDYIRTCFGIIGKVFKIEEEIIEIEDVRISKKDIIDCSKDLKELIKIGDYVNRHLVIQLR